MTRCTSYCSKLCQSDSFCWLLWIINIAIFLKYVFIHVLFCVCWWWFEWEMSPIDSFSYLNTWFPVLSLLREVAQSLGSHWSMSLKSDFESMWPHPPSSSLCLLGACIWRYIGVLVYFIAITNAMPESDVREEGIYFILGFQVTAHFWGKTGWEPKQELEAQTMERSCFLACTLAHFLLQPKTAYLDLVLSIVV